MNALNVNQVGERVGFTPRTIRDLTRQGKFPPPIDPTLGPRMWRWSPTAIEAYVTGAWGAAA